jgi:hypothetical protein
VRVIELTGNAAASVDGCVYDDLVTYSVDSGAILDDSIAWKQVHADLVQEGGTWRIEYLEIGQPGGGGTECVGT